MKLFRLGKTNLDHENKEKTDRRKRHVRSVTFHLNHSENTSHFVTNPGGYLAKTLGMRWLLWLHILLLFILNTITFFEA